MKYHKNALFKLSIVLLAMFFVVAGCVEEVENGWSTPTEPTTFPTTPGSEDLTGTIIGTIYGRVLAGVTVSARGISTSTGTDGIFRLNGVGDGIFGVIISGNDIYTHTTAVNTANGRSVLLDAIERNSDFHLGFYRELARIDDYGYMHPTYRWTNLIPPTFIIDTNASATRDGRIDQGQINTVRDIIKRMVPIWTGNFYSSVQIETRSFSRLDINRDIPNNAYVITFDDSLISRGAFGETIYSSSANVINKTLIWLVDDMDFYRRGGITFEEIISHEMGHGFGFEHTSLLPSVMLPVGAYGGLYSEADRLHAAIMYSRPAGNTDIDNDPIASSKVVGPISGLHVHIDRRANFPLSSELLEELESLPSKIPEEYRGEGIY
jgi:hypothetical protein